MAIYSAPNRGLSIISISIISLLVLLPLVGLLYNALMVETTVINNPSSSLGELWSRYHILDLIFRTLQLGFCVAALNVIIGCWLAWVNQRYHFFGRKILAVVSLIPLAIPSFIFAATLRDSLSPGGWAGQILGIPMFTGFIPATIALTLATLPFTQLLLSTRLATLSYQQEEAAARTLGANNFQIFWRITWPYLRPSLFFSWLISFLYAISDFGAVAVLDYPVLTWRLYQAVEYQQLLLASLLGSVLLTISLPLFFLTRFLQGNRLQPHRQKNYAWLSLPLPNGLYIPVWITYLFIITIGVVLPVGTLVQWVSLGWKMQLPFADIGSALNATLLLALGGGLFITMLAYLPAWVAAHARRFLDSYLEQMIYLTGGLPSILVGFGLLLSALMVAPLGLPSNFYHIILSSGILLLMGYTLRFLPQAYAYLKTAVLNLDEHQYASARLLGASSFYWWRHLACPRLWPSFRAAFIVVVLGISKELPLTLLLGNATGLQPLTVRIFDRYQEAFLFDAGLAGLVLIAFCSLLTLWTLRWKIYVSG